MASLPTPVTFDRVVSALEAAGHKLVRSACGGPLALSTVKDVPVLFLLNDPWLKVRADQGDNYDPTAWRAITERCNEWNTMYVNGMAYPVEKKGGLDVRVELVTDCEAGLTDEQLELYLRAGIEVCVRSYHELRAMLAGLPRKWVGG